MACFDRSTFQGRIVAPCYFVEDLRVAAGAVEEEAVELMKPCCFVVSEPIPMLNPFNKSTGAFPIPDTYNTSPLQFVEHTDVSQYARSVAT
jgi:hypothetical protein